MTAPVALSNADCTVAKLHQLADRCNEMRWPMCSVADADPISPRISSGW